MTLRLAAAAAAVVLTTAGCGATPAASPSKPGLSQGTNHPTDTTSTATAPTTDAGAAPALTSPVAQPAPSKLGARFTYQDGLVIQLGKPARFQPSDTAAAAKAVAYVSFKVTVVNGTRKAFDPSMFTVSVQSADTEAGEVIDIGKGFDGAPSTVVLPRRESSFTVGFGVRNPTDLVVQVTPGFDYEPAVFTS